MKRRNIANLARLEALMDEAGLDALVLRSGQNFTYLSGVVYPGTLARHMDLTDSTRPVLLVWPRIGKPVIVANKTAAGLVERDGWIDDFVLYEAYVESANEKLSEVLGQMGLASSRIGFEKDYWSAAHWEAVRKALPGMRMEECTGLMDRVRWIKTAAEVALIRQGADLLDDAYLEAFGRIRPGDTERKVHADIIGTCLRLGFEWAHGIFNLFRNTVPYGGESDMVIEKGDAIRTDYVGYLSSYPGHQSRTVIVGEPTAGQKRDYAINLEVHRGLIDRCRPGAKVHDLWAWTMGEYRKAGWPDHHMLIGHGVGCWWHQQEPILRRKSEHILEEGMVLALEPHVNFWHVQDMILVRNGAPELLSAKFNTNWPFVAAG
ncbi:MAG: aminopeptidase P family protein [Betaproteobacteria bacterium]|nr:aminopeptidase P family protein [Betaproteobacteria bacterium]